MRTSDFMRSLNGDGFGIGWYDAKLPALETICSDSAPLTTIADATSSSSSTAPKAAAKGLELTATKQVVGEYALHGNGDAKREAKFLEDEVAHEQNSSSSSTAQPSTAPSVSKSTTTTIDDVENARKRRKLDPASTTTPTSSSPTTLPLENWQVPCVFTSITPAWNNINLRRLSEKVVSRTVLAHVRAASPGLVTSQTNCHPFQYRQFLFMHNGGVAHFGAIKRELLFSLRERYFGLIEGSTDSELCFYLVLNEIDNLIEAHAATTTVMSRATLYRQAFLNVFRILARAVSKATEQCGAAGGEHASLLNFCLTDGEVCVVSRVSYPAHCAPASLFYASGTSFSDVSGQNTFRMQHADRRALTHIVSSEPLTTDAGDWIEVPPNHVVTINERNNMLIEPVII